MEIIVSTKNTDLLPHDGVSRRKFLKFIGWTTAALALGGTARIALSVPPAHLDTAPAVPPVFPPPPATPANPNNPFGLAYKDGGNASTDATKNPNNPFGLAYNEGGNTLTDAIGEKKFPSIRLTIHEFTKRSPGEQVGARKPANEDELTLLAAKYATHPESILQANSDYESSTMIEIPSTRPLSVSPANDQEYMSIMRIFLEDIGRYGVLFKPDTLYKYDDFALRLRMAVANHTYTEIQAIKPKSTKFMDFQARILSALSNQQKVLAHLMDNRLANAKRMYNFTEGDIKNLAVARNSEFDKLLKIMLPPPPRIQTD